MSKKVHETGTHFAFRSGSPLSNFFVDEFRMYVMTEDYLFCEHIPECPLLTEMEDGMIEYETYFKSGEHAFQLYKALEFKDYDKIRPIWEAETPLEAKRLGRKVENFNQEIWDEVKYKHMENICWYRADLPSVATVLREAKGYEIVEAAPRDVIWGSGYGIDKSAIGESRGANLLGRAWTHVNSHD